MKMTRMEKRFVNSEKKAMKNIEKLQRHLKQLDCESIEKALEIGCGMGAVASYLAKNGGMNVWAIDVDPQQVELAQRHYSGNELLHYQVGDATDMSFETSSFDLVISQDVFHHIPDWKAAVSEISRVLKPGGYLFWMDLVLARIFKLLNPFVKNYGIYTLDDIRRAFRKNHLTEQKHERVFHGGMTSHQMILQRATAGN